MADTWFTDLTHFLDEDGKIEPADGPARRLADHLVMIVLMFTRQDIVHVPGYKVSCRRRPGRKPCTGIIEADLDIITDEIMWWCPVCGDHGYISNWQGTMWDFRNAARRPKDGPVDYTDLLS